MMFHCPARAGNRRVSPDLLPVEPTEGVLQEERCADGRDQGHEAGRAAQRAVGDSLQQQRHTHRNHGREDEHDQEGQRRLGSEKP